MMGVVEVGMRGGRSRPLACGLGRRTWSRRVVYVLSTIPGKSWDGGVDTVIGADAIKDKNPGFGGRTRRMRW